jgi:peptide methionine sulfoxide reductase msrA/msrB
MSIKDIGNNTGQVSGYKEIHLAGGCFWGIEKLMKSLPGVVSATSGYANGREDINPTYETVCSGLTGFRETVKVIYDPIKISLDAILFAFFSVIDPTQKNRQGNDIGTQYQTGVYYSDEASRLTVERIADIERERHKAFYVEIGLLKNFFEAEEYHQDYIGKNPSGYCHITPDKINKISKMQFDPGVYKRPEKDILTEKLTNLQYRVTQESATEPPFKNEYWNHFERGIYVDIVTGEPLFASSGKYHSSCGWPGFSQGIDENSFIYLEDNSHFLKRTEVRSRVGNSHLGHIFHNDPESPNGVRFCINSAAITFIPYEEMDAKGYGDLKKYV